MFALDSKTIIFVSITIFILTTFPILQSLPVLTSIFVFYGIFHGLTHPFIPIPVHPPHSLNCASKRIRSGFGPGLDDRPDDRLGPDDKSDILKKFSSIITRNYITTWYTGVSLDQEFSTGISSDVESVLSVICGRGERIDVFTLFGKVFLRDHYDLLRITTALYNRLY